MRSIKEVLLTISGKKKRNIKDMKELRDVCSMSVNTFGLDPVKLAEDIMSDDTAKEMFLQIAISWIRFTYEKGFRFSDGRNEIAIAKCIEMYQSEYFRALCDAVGNDDFYTEIAEEFAGYSLEMHRTLMQQFTGVVISALCIADPYGIGLDFRYDCKLPLI